MNHRVSLYSVVCATFLVMWPGADAWAGGNAAAGAVIFEEDCSECHSINTSAKNKNGPTLRGVVGRKVGAAPGYDDYSDSVKKSKLIWTVGELDKYLTNPKRFSPTIKMKFDGIADAKARADLIEYLSTKK
jgi:cytochrome c